MTSADGNAVEEGDVEEEQDVVDGDGEGERETSSLLKDGSSGEADIVKESSD